VRVRIRSQSRWILSQSNYEQLLYNQYVQDSFIERRKRLLLFIIVLDWLGAVALLVSTLECAIARSLVHFGLRHDRHSRPLRAIACVRACVCAIVSVTIVRFKGQMSVATFYIVYHVMTMLNDVLGLTVVLSESLTGLSVYLTFCMVLMGGSLAISFSPIIFLHMINFLFSFQVRSYIAYRVRRATATARSLDSLTHSLTALLVASACHYDSKQ